MWIMEVRYQWRVGDGRSIKVKQDRWISRLPRAKISPLKGTLVLNELRVSDLMNKDKRGWNGAILMSLFE